LKNTIKKARKRKKVTKNNMTITIIAAIANNNALGKDNQLIWHLSADLKRFKKLTTGHHIIMGRKTFESIGKPLPNRTSIIITRNKDYQQEGCLVANSLEDAIKMVNNDEFPYIIGGAQIYKEAIKVADKLDITFVHHDFEADVFFPEIDLKIWKEISREIFEPDEKNKFKYSFVSFERIKKEEEK
jgi:dihydrofolate reductase